MSDKKKLTDEQIRKLRKLKQKQVEDKELVKK